MNDRFGRKKLDFSEKRFLLFHFFLVVGEVTDNICTAEFQRTNVRHSYMYYVIPFLIWLHYYMLHLFLYNTIRILKYHSSFDSF